MHLRGISWTKTVRLCVDLAIESCYNIDYSDTTHFPPKTLPAEIG